MEPLTIFIFAVLLGVTHAFEADHIAAITTLSKDAKHSGKLGMFWGMGHTTTLFIVGTLLLVFKVSLSESFSVFFESIVGVLLIVFGIRMMIATRRDRLHIHEHIHDGERHAHFHSHKYNNNHRHLHTSFAFGLLHGLAGSGALVLIALASVDSLYLGGIFILLFGLGSTFGMTAISFLIGFTLQKAKRITLLHHYLRLSAATFSAFVGATLIAESLIL